MPMAEPLFSGGGTLMGARGLLASPEAPLLPSTLLQVSGTPAHGPRLPVAQPPPLTLPCLPQPGSASQLGLHGAFLAPELPPVPLPPEPPATAPGGLSPQLRHKALLQYGLPGKCLSLEPPGPPYASPVPSPRVPLLGPDPPFSPASAPRSKFPYTGSPNPSLLAHPASPLPTPCLDPHAPGLGYAASMVPPGYPGPAAPQLLPPALLGDPRFAPPKGLPQGGGGRPKAKPSGTKAKTLPGPPAPPPLAMPNPCLSQLLSTGKGAGGLWGAQGRARGRGGSWGGGDQTGGPTFSPGLGRWGCGAEPNPGVMLFPGGSPPGSSIPWRGPGGPRA